MPFYGRVRVPRGGGRTIVAAAAATASVVLAAPAGAVVNLSEEGAKPTKDFRAGQVLPTAAQKTAAAALGADGVRFNRFGTPRVLRDVKGAPLASGLSLDAPTAAKQFLKANAGLFRLTSTAVDGLKVVNDSKIGDTGHVVLLRQQFGALRPTEDGLATVAVKDGKVLYVSSSLTGDTTAPQTATLTPANAFLKLASNVGAKLSLSNLTGVKKDGEWTVFKIPGADQLQRVRLTALPTPKDGVKAAFETWYIGKDGAYKGFVDGNTGTLLYRQNVSLNAVGCGPNDTAPTSNSADFEPDWCAFQANPTPVSPIESAAKTPDTRALLCWKYSSGCQRTLNNETPVNDQFGGRWDELFVPLPVLGGNLGGQTTGTTSGNNAYTYRNWINPLAPGGDAYQPPNGTPDPLLTNRDYRYAFTDQWHTAQCNPSVFTNPLGGNDSNAAVTNLFVQHNRMHDFSYFLGFTEQHYNMQVYNFGRGATGGGVPPESREGDPQFGQSQAGAVTGGPSATGLGRDNANQIPLPDGISPISNMYLWQPLDSGFYPPCVDGDYDMSVIGHEYTHATSNRMVAGPDAGLDQGSQAGAMGESWSDQVALEYLHEFGLVPVAGEDPWSVGAYVTGNQKTGIRDYAFDKNPLNFSDIGFDTPGVEVHSDGEIWNGVAWELRKAFVAKYGSATPAVQAQCAAGRRVATVCPGNRRWIQNVFDAFLLMQSNVDFLDARDAYLTANQLRFNGADQSIMWAAFAKRGMGVNAQTIGGDDPDPTADFENPTAGNATVTFAGTTKDGGAAPQNVKFFVGDYEGDVTQIADTIPTQPDEAPVYDNKAKFTPGTYTFIAQAPGYGATKVTKALAAGQTLTLSIAMPKNLASTSAGAVATGSVGCDVSGDPLGSCADDADVLDNLIDDTESTSWRSDGVPVNASRVFVDLAGTTPQTVKQFKVSAFPNPIDGTDDPTSDSPVGRNRFTTLRSFEVRTCTAAAGVDCTQDSQYKTVFTSAANAFPSVAPRPIAPDLILRTFVLPTAVKATHVEFHPLTNQCTGVALFQTDYDADSTNDPDCRNSTSDKVTAAEFQVNAVTG